MHKQQQQVKQEVQMQVPTGDNNDKILYDAQTNKFVCKHCNFNSDYRRSVLRHINTKHVDDFDGSKPLTEVPDVKFENTFKTETTSETNVKSCGECSFSTVHAFSLRRHLQLKHGFPATSSDDSSNKKYSCFHCDFKTEHSSSLKRHIELKHAETIKAEEPMSQEF